MTEERRQLILRWILKEGSITLKELEKRLNISLMTIRRDLNVLEKQHRIKRVRGGAIKNNNNIHFLEMQSSDRKKIHHVEKTLISKYAVEHFVKENDIIVLEGGTTVSSMVYNLTIPNLKIITNGLNVINYATNYLENNDIVCCGGLFFEKEFTFVGPQAEVFFSEFRAHKCFFGADGLTIEDGATVFNVSEIGVKRAMLRCAKQRILLIDSSKLGLSSLVLAVPLKDIDIIVTDSNAPQVFLNDLQSQNIEVHIAK